MPRKKSPRSNWTEVKKAASRFNQPELIELLRDLYRLSEKNRNFIHARLSVGEDPIDSYRRIIWNCLYVDLFEEKEGDRISEAEEAISEYAMAADDPRGVAELMIHFVESGQKFTLDWGDMGERFYDSLLEMYEKALEQVLSLPEEEKEELRERLHNLVTSSSGLGWGYHDDLGSLFSRAFPDKD